MTFIHVLLRALACIIRPRSVPPVQSLHPILIYFIKYYLIKHDFRVVNIIVENSGVHIFKHRL